MEFKMNLKTITDTAKTALDIANELKNVELKSAILDLKEQLLALREENIALKEQLNKQTSYNLVYEGDLYWNYKEDNDREGPFCPACKDNNGKVIHLKKYYSGGTRFQCHVCGYDVHFNR